MANEIKSKIKLAKDNEHLLDIFTDDYYLELGTIEFDPMSSLLKGNLVEYTQIAYFDILSHGIGEMESNSKEMKYKLPFMHFYNIVNKNKSNMLVITYGLLLQKKGYKETFVPIILIPVKMYLENESIYFQMVSKPIENPYIKQEKIDLVNELYNKEKIDDIYSMDKYVLNCAKHQPTNVRLESYLTFVRIEEPEIQIHHEMFNLENQFGSSLTERYSIDKKDSNYNITILSQNQRNALGIASTGKSFAITGYEGCGKTTTLINIASDAIKKSKRILYISNNDSTLSKVYDTFKEKGLESFVTSFSKPFFSFNERVHETRHGQILDCVLKNELLDNYKNIENYENKLSSKIKNFHLIDIMNELILTPKPNEVFEEKIMKNSYILCKYEINEIINALQVIDEKMPKLGSFKDSHYINVPILHQIDDINQLLDLMKTIKDHFSLLQEERVVLENEYSFADIINYARFKNLITNYTKLDKKKVPSSWYSLYKDGYEIKESFQNFNDAKAIYPHLKNEIEHYQSTLKDIKSIYNINKYKFDVASAIKNITSDIFKKEEVTNINRVLTNYIEINKKVVEGRNTCHTLESIFDKLKSKLNYSLLLNNVKEIEAVNDFMLVLSKENFTKNSLDFSKSKDILNKLINIETILDHYEESLNIFLKFFDSLSALDNGIRILQKKNKDKNSKFKHTLISELLPHLYYVQKNHTQVVQLRKTYKDLTNKEYKYKVHLSDIYNELIQKHSLITNEKTRMQIDKAVQNFRSSDVLDIVTTIRSYQDTLDQVNNLFKYILDYKLVSNTDDLNTKIDSIRKTATYMSVVCDWQKEMRSFLMIPRQDILFDSYLYFDEKEKELNKVINSINNNEKYKFLFDKLFNGENTVPSKIENIIDDFDDYLLLFKKQKGLVNSFIDKKDQTILSHIENANMIIDAINNDFLIYIKLFKDTVSKYYYDDILVVIDYFNTLYTSKKELELYLGICDEMKIILKYKMDDLNDYIINNSNERITNRFKYSYFKHLYDGFVKENPDFINSNQYNEILEKTTRLEKELIDSNVEIIKINNNHNFRVEKANNMNYNQYIIKNKDSKYLFLSDTNIVNLFLDMTLFDIVLIDDAHLLNANEYYKAIKCPQVIIAGTENLQTSISNSLISRIRHNAIIPFKYRFTRTPFNLLMKMKNIKGRFYSNVNDNKGISICKDNYNSLIAKLIKTNPESKINFFTASLAKAHDIYQVIGNILYDKGKTIGEIISFFNDKLNICDLKDGYSIEADFNILDYSTYHEVNDEYVSYNMADLLISCKKELIILDSKNLLTRNTKNYKFGELILNIIDEQKQELNYLPNTIHEKIAKALKKYQIDTLGTYYPLSLVLEHNEKYYGLMILENPGCTEFTILNEYREFKTNEFPLCVVWLSDLVNDFDKSITRIVKEIKL